MTSILTMTRGHSLDTFKYCDQSPGYKVLWILSEIYIGPWTAKTTDVCETPSSSRLPLSSFDTTHTGAEVLMVHWHQKDLRLPDSHAKR
jgi:hypothetical protein